MGSASLQSDWCQILDSQFVVTPVEHHTQCDHYHTIEILTSGILSDHRVSKFCKMFLTYIGKMSNYAKNHSS